jgi:hypothetical protein
MPFDPFSAGASVVGGIVGGIGANKAAQKQADAAKASMDMQRRNMLMGLQVNEPARNIGYQAYGDIAQQFGYDMPAYADVNSLTATLTPMHSKDMAKLLKQGVSYDQLQGMGSLAGLNAKAIKRLTKAGLSLEQIQGLTGGARAQPQGQPTQQQRQPSGNAFIDSPDYAFRRDEGQRGVGNSFAARGGAASGNALKALSEFNSNLASGEFGNWFNRRMALSGRGDQAASNVQSGGQSYAQGYGQAQNQLGDARASGVFGVTGAIQGGLSGVAGSFGGGGNSLSAFRNNGNGGYYGSGSFNPSRYGINPGGVDEYQMPQYNLGGG